jgi:hemolysin activation/secretion protein
MQIKQLVGKGVGLVMFLLPSVFAADPSALIREQQLREQQQLEELQERPDIFLPEAQVETPIAKPDEAPAGPCFEITRIAIEGAPTAWLSWLQQPPLMALPRCINSEDIKTVRHTLLNRLLAQGFITSRIELPAQNLQEGVLRLTVQPGYVGKIYSKEGRSDWALRSAFPLQGGDILNMRDLEQGLEQLGRPMTQQAQLEITPGDALGTSDIVVARDNQFPLSVGISWDNSGLEGTGRWQLGSYLVWDRPLQLNDMLILAVNQDSRHLHHPGSRGNALAYILPWGNWTWGVNLSQYHYEQTLMGVYQPFTSSGRTKSGSISLGWLLHRGQSSKTELTTQLTHKINRGYIEDIELLIHRRRLSIVSLSMHHRHHIGPLVLNAQIGIQRGVGWFNAESVPEPLPDWYPNARALIYTSRLNTHLPFKMANTTWRWSSEWHGHYSPDMLFGSEQLSIGNHYTVRGFQTGLAGSRGQYWRNELVWSALPPNPQGRMLDFYIGADVGRISKVPYPINTQTLAGWVIGVRGAISKHTHAELSLARPIHMPVTLPRERVVYFKVVING